MKTALVTGASRGLGLETCRQLTQRGLRVLPASRAGAGQRRLDVADPSSVAALAGELRREGVTVDVLVNNAGIALDGFDAEVARGTLDVNFFGALRVTDALLPLMPDGGNIVMVSSGMGEISCVGPALRASLMDPGLTRDALVTSMRSFVDAVAQGRHTKAGWPSSAYRVSKVGLDALTRVLARELAGRRIRVNAVCPGWVRTDMGGRARRGPWRKGLGRSCGPRCSRTGRPAGSSVMGKRLGGETEGARVRIRTRDRPPNRRAVSGRRRRRARTDSGMRRREMRP